MRLRPPMPFSVRFRSAMTRSNARILPFVVCFTCVAVLGVFAGSSSAKAQPEADPVDISCKKTKFKIDEVKALCEDKTKGRPAVKKMMKKLVKEQKAKGEKVNCKSCHKNTKTYDLKPNAVKDLRKWLDA